MSDPDDTCAEPPPESVAGVPKKLGIGGVIGIALLVIAGGGVVVSLARSPIFARKLARIPLTAVGATADAAIELPAGKQVLLGVVAASYSYQGRNSLVVDAQLLRGGLVVGHLTCQGFLLKGSGGSGTQASHYNSDCTTTAPERGVTSLRVTTHLSDPSGSTSFEGLGIEVVDR